MRAVLFSSWTLFFGIFLFMAGNGLQGVALGVRAENLDFGDIITSIVMSGYYFGFLIGSLMVPKLLSFVGHVRVFAALSAIASSSILIHAFFEYATIWTLMRILTGFAYSGMYISAESWINEKATNKTRGALLSIYMIITMLGLIVGQLLTSFSEGEPSKPFIMISLLVSISVLPILLTASHAPEFEEPERISLLKVYNVSPLAMIGMLSHGMSAAVLFAIGAVYATKIGLSIQWTGIFMAMAMFGGLVFQYPIGWISDYFDRRTVILIVQSFAVITAFVAFLSEVFFLNPAFPLFLVLAVFIYGGFHMPLYSLYIAHANDYLTPNQIVSTSSMLVMVNGIGAVFGAPIVGYFMYLFGASAFFVTLGLMNLGMAVFVVVRIFSRESMPIEAQGPFVAMPKNSTGLATTLLPDAEWIEDEDEDEEETSLPF